ncbi:MAG: bifunctional oligoribonuclease/PAP phosphatase NrnA [Verrucomicrobiales bacterium]|nr:bifunctional oligoribonuclease/PAP phosphatase NrnA [Verrucomicrobiales bacterium]
MGDFSSIIERIDSASRVLVLSHDRPDGDAIGSAMAAALLLEKAGKSVVVMNNDKVPDLLAFLPQTERIQRPVAGEMIDCELVLVLDSAGRDRIRDAVWEVVPEGVFTINIDHHVSNSEFADINYVDSDSPATGQILFQLAEAAGWEIDAEIATHLYAAISTDTGSFRYPSTTSETMRIGGALIDAGVDLGRTNRMLYENYPRRRVEAMQILLQGLRFDCDGKCASVRLPLGVSGELGLQLGDTEGVIDVIRAIDSVTIAVFFEELPGGKIRVSSRSKDPAAGVGEICAIFGGGGHTLAAGARLPGPLEDAEERFLSEVRRKLDSLQR